MLSYIEKRTKLIVTRSCVFILNNIVGYRKRREDDKPGVGVIIYTVSGVSFAATCSFDNFDKAVKDAVVAPVGSTFTVKYETMDSQPMI